MLPKGHCHLCGEEKGLTYEHVPARSTFNQEPVEMFGLESWLTRAPDGEMSGGELKERGAGAYTLCYRCNTEITGDHYVAELKRWTAAGMRVAQELARGAVGNAVDLKLSRAYPARLIKQIVAMLASVNSGDLLEHHRALSAYTMDPHAIGLPSRYQFYLIVTHPNSIVFRYAGLSVLLVPGRWCGTWVTDLVWPPLGYVMTIDEECPLLPLGNISHFANYGYDERVDVEIQLPVLVGDQPYPGEFSDPVDAGGFVRPRAELPTKESARIPIRVVLADGYTSDSGELAYPTAFDKWTGAELRELLEGMLRALCVLKGETYKVSIRWFEAGVALRAISGAREMETVTLPLPLSAVAEFIGHDTVPPSGEAEHEDVMRFKEDE